MKKIIIFFLVFVFLFSICKNVSSQERDVCLVYFTSYGCGDDCGLTDTFMDGLMNEYLGNIFLIKYYVDASEENRNVFESYRGTYNLPQDVPIVLFGRDDYLQGIGEIYENTEAKIFGFMQINGTNCPLDSGYVPPSQVSTANLPGQPEIKISGIDASNDDGKEKGVPPENRSSGTAGQNPFYGIFTIEESMKESLLSVVIIAVAIIAVVLVGLFIWQKSQG